MSRPRVAIATCAGYEDLEVDDALLGEALRERGCEAESIVWDREEPDWSGFDLCLLRSTWDYHDKHPEFLAWTRRVEAGTALHHPADLIAWNSDKTYLRGLAETGVPTVPTLWVKRGTGIDLEQALTERGWDEAVIKPVVDLGAKNLHRVQAGTGEAQQALEAVLTRQAAMVQPFLPSLEAEGETSLIYIDGAFTHAVRKRPAAGDFRVQSIWGGTFKRTEPTTSQTEIAERAITQLEETPLYARVDLVTGPGDDPRLIELELIEPNLYLSTNPGAAAQLANAVLSQLSQEGPGTPHQTLNIEP
jgi:glutathione synthase/RimK-type ligase-like ATP-grasp enzyme